MKRTFFLTAWLALSLVLAGCTAPAASPTVALLPPTGTPLPPTATPVPYTPTSEPPTATPQAPTATPVPSAATATPAAVAEATATPTPVPPTATPTPEPTWKADGVVDDGEYVRQIEAAGVTLHWLNDAEHLYAALTAQTEGWVAVGFDPQARMQGANYVFGYVKDGQASMQDMYGAGPAGPGSHPPDEELGGRNDILEYGGREEGGLTVIEFKIPLDSGEEYDKPLRPGSSYKVILAMGSSDDFESYHAARDYAEITLD